MIREPGCAEKHRRADKAPAALFRQTRCMSRGKVTRGGRKSAAAEYDDMFALSSCMYKACDSRFCYTAINHEETVKPMPRPSHNEMG